jgi:hypothetical protein
MAEEIRERKDEIVEDIETSLAKIEAGYRAGYRMLIHPDGFVEILTGELARHAKFGNPHHSCCCCCG